MRLHRFINNDRKLGLWEYENKMESGLFTGCFYIGFKGETFNNLLTFDLDSEYSILKIFSTLKSRLVEKVFPFARDPFGNYICFDYRSGGDPTIVFWEHEAASIDNDSAISKVCDSFSELLDMLEEREEEEF